MHYMLRGTRRQTLTCPKTPKYTSHFVRTQLFQGTLCPLPPEGLKSTAKHPAVYCAARHSAVYCATRHLVVQCTTRHSDVYCAAKHPAVYCDPDTQPFSVPPDTQPFSVPSDAQPLLCPRHSAFHYAPGPIFVDPTLLRNQIIL